MLTHKHKQCSSAQLTEKCLHTHTNYVEKAVMKKKKNFQTPLFYVTMLHLNPGMLQLTRTMRLIVTFNSQYSKLNHAYSVCAANITAASYNSRHLLLVCITFWTHWLKRTPRYRKKCQKCYNHPRSPAIYCQIPLLYHDNSTEIVNLWEILDRDPM